MAKAILRWFLLFLSREQPDSDGIKAEKGRIIVNGGEITLKVADDGIVASYEGDETLIPDVIINGGKINIETTGSGGEGIESKATLSINNGEIYIKAIDDAINAGKAIYINGGTIVAYSSTNDGIDSNGTMTITGGHIFAIGAKSPEEGFDWDNNTFSAEVLAQVAVSVDKKIHVQGCPRSRPKKLTGSCNLNF